MFLVLRSILTLYTQCLALHVSCLHSVRQFSTVCIGGLAQLVEQLTLNQRVTGSSPVASTPFAPMLLSLDIVFIQYYQGIKACSSFSRWRFMAGAVICCPFKTDAFNRYKTDTVAKSVKVSGKIFRGSPGREHFARKKWEANPRSNLSQLATAGYPSNQMASTAQTASLHWENAGATATCFVAL